MNIMTLAVTDKKVVTLVYSDNIPPIVWCVDDEGDVVNPDINYARLERTMGIEIIFDQRFDGEIFVYGNGTSARETDGVRKLAMISEKPAVENRFTDVPPVSPLSQTQLAIIGYTTSEAVTAMNRETLTDLRIYPSKEQIRDYEGRQIREVWIS